jgi:hypothetical protein
MTDKTKKVIEKFEKTIIEIDKAALAMTEAIKAFHVRIERVEEWILRQKNQPVK